MLSIEVWRIPMSRDKDKKELTEYESKLKEYYWKCFISEISKVIFFLIIFVLLGLTVEYLIALFFLMLFRINGGGLHFQHFVSCLIVSFAFLAVSILLALYITPQPIFMIISLLLCIPIIYHLVPITSVNRPPATPEQIRKSKRNTCIIMVVLILLICICPDTIYLHIGYWTVILHMLQLIIAQIIKGVKKNV